MKKISLIYVIFVVACAISYLIFVGITKLILISLEYLGLNFNYNVWALGFIIWVIVWIVKYLKK